MFQHIMVPLDGSELAEQALPYARYLARTTGGRLHVVLAVEPPSAVRAHGLGAPVNVYEQVIAEQRREAEEYLDRIRERVQAEGLAVQVKRLDGHPPDVLLDYAREAGIDLMVMTTHGRSGRSRWSLGSVADRVAHGGAVAVLLVPAEAAAQV